MITVTGIFNSRADAERAIELLHSIGISDDHLALLTPGASEEEVAEAVPVVETEEPGTGKKIGSAVGRGLGIAGGMLIGSAVGSFFVPGVGTVFAAGVLGAALLGTGGASLGAAAGNTLDEKVAAHIQHEELHIFEDALRQGRTIIIALAKDEEEAEAAHARLADAGAASLVEARESWWSGLRVTEGEEYAKSGRDFTGDETLFRRGFEAAQHPAWRGKSFAETADELRGRYGDDYQQEAFRRGYERGLAHHHRVMEKYQRKPNRESGQSV
jgi:hypothetical protein